MLMRIFALLFGFYIMYLALLPGISTIADNHIEVETCCSDSCGSSEPEPTDCEDGEDGCNPFQSCYCCIGFNMSLSFIPATADILFFKSHIEVKEKVPPHIALDFWQPPKIV